MDIYWEYSGCDLDDEREIERHWAQILPDLEANLEGLADPATELRLAIGRDEEVPEWHIHAALHLPGRTAAVEVEANELARAMDDLLTGLSGEIDKLQDATIHVTKRMQGLEGIVAILQDSHRGDRREAFMSFLTPVVGSFAPYTQRELQLREIEGTLTGMQLTVADVLDEVLVRAWQQFRERPQAASLDSWILRLVDQALDDASEATPCVSLEDELAEPSREDSPSQRDYWEEQVSYPESIELHELLPGAPAGDVWDDIDGDVKQRQVARLLTGIPRQQRQALLLCAVHGFSETEVADFQDRSPAEVRRDIELATTSLAQRLTNG